MIDIPAAGEAQAEKSSPEPRQAQPYPGLVIHKRFANVEELLTARKPVLDVDVEEGTAVVDSILGKRSDPPQSDIEEEILTPPTLTDLFPDLGFYTGPAPPEDGRIHKRMDEGQTNSHRIAHTSRLLDIRPVFVSSLQPAKNHANGTWDLHDGLWFEDPKGSTDIPDEVVSSSWGVISGRSYRPVNPRLAPAVPVPSGQQIRHQHVWTEEEDAILLRLVATYPFNWQLISDTLNSDLTVIPTDRPSAYDCWDRYHWTYGDGKGRPRPEPKAIVPAAVKGAQTPVVPPSATAQSSTSTPAGTAGGATPAPSSAVPPSAGPSGRPAQTPSGQQTPGGGISVPTLPSQNGTDGLPEGAPPPPGMSKRDAKQAGKNKYEGTKKSIRHQVLFDSMRRLVRRREQAKQKTAGGSCY